MAARRRIYIIVFVAFLLVNIVVGYFLPRKPGPWRVTFDRLRYMGMSVREYRLTTGHLPSVEELLEQLSREGRSALDGWGRQIAVIRDDEGNFVFLSAGRDGLLNTKDDMIRVERRLTPSRPWPPVKEY